MTPFELLYYAAASWAIAFMATSTDGPFGIFARAREWRSGRWHGRIQEPEMVVTTSANTSYEQTQVKGGEVKYHGLLDCVICLMFWIALILHFIGVNIVTDAFAIAGIALWVHAYSSWVHIGGK